MIKIVEGLLSKYYLQELKNYFLEYDNWKFKSNITGSDDLSFGDIGFDQTLYDTKILKSSNSVPFISPICDSFNSILTKPLLLTAQEQVEEFIGRSVIPIRSRADMTVYNPEKYKHGIHIDIPLKHITCIFYINNSDGNTIIYDYNKTIIIKEIEPVENRLLIFDGNLPHTGHSPSKNKFRILINMNFFDEDSCDEWKKNELYH